MAGRPSRHAASTRTLQTASGRSLLTSRGPGDSVRAEEVVKPRPGQGRRRQVRGEPSRVSPGTQPVGQRDWIATYRLQLNRSFPLRAAAAVLPYLARLGMSHVYLSPCLQAAPGSEHGYDVVDPTRVSDELGGEDAWAEFQQAAKRHGLGVLLDIVPNHMSTAAENSWWCDVLRHGPYSRHARTFDLNPMAEGEPWRLRLCTLPGPYGEVLKAGEFSFDLDAPEPWLTCAGQRWPINPLTWWEAVGTPPGSDEPPGPDWPAWRLDTAPGRAARARYWAAVQVAQTRWREARGEAGRGSGVLGRAEEIRRDPDRLHALVDRQFFRPCWWRREGERVNFRRFFNIGSLVGVRMEDAEVMATTHARVMRMVEAGEVDGLRVDHPDGLRDPGGYLAALRRSLPGGRIYVEKILDAEETLPGSWPVEGTVGYDFLGKVNRLWMAAENSDRLTAIYSDFTGHTVNFPRLVREKKLAIIAAAFPADRDHLVQRAAALARRHWSTLDLSPRQLREALVALTAMLPVYRTYLPGTSAADRAADLHVLDATLAQVASYAREVEPAVFAFLRSLLAAEKPDEPVADFMARWQQLAPAVMAKGTEDTTFYLYDRLVSGNEVGSQPSLVGIPTEQFHAYCHRLQVRWPHNLLATSTHDNKRSEDVRIRISLLTEIADRWAEAVQEWSRLNQPAWAGRVPDRHAEYLLYQTLVGTWPIDAGRACAYMIKACREARVQTSWHEPNSEYEEAITGFTRRILESPGFVRALEAFVLPLLRPARIHSLGQTLIKMTAPGVPDFYQGTELWDLSLVDPDNRRPVDFDLRRELLERCDAATPGEVMEQADSGWPKLWMIARVLRFRRTHAECFGAGAVHEPVTARGSRLAHVLGFRRGDSVLVLVPRFQLTLRDNWGDTAVSLPPGRWRNVFTGDEHEAEVPLAPMFAAFPVALLHRAGGKGDAP